MPKVHSITMEDVQKVSAALLDSGKPIEAGWQAFYEVVLKPQFEAQAGPRDHTEAKEMLHKTFFAGAKYLFDVQMFGMTEDKEPTDLDMQRMNNIHAELAFYGEALKKSLYNT